MRFHFKCTEMVTTIIAPPIMMKPDNRSTAQQWRMLHQTPHNFSSFDQNVVEVILNYGNKKAKLKLPFPFIDFEFEGYAYFVEPGEKVKKMQESVVVWEYTPLKFIITLSENQHNLLFNSLGGKYIEDV